ncbi:hypothetical protein OH77DRAFT_830470 [Trametes cingulata]|nr:hypothetical protein OH77DRAFT_830470 [Trametes cingulata]
MPVQRHPHPHPDNLPPAQSGPLALPISLRGETTLPDLHYLFIPNRIHNVRRHRFCLHLRSPGRQHLCARIPVGWISHAPWRHPRRHPAYGRGASLHPYNHPYARTRRCCPRSGQCSAPGVPTLRLGVTHTRTRRRRCEPLCGIVAPKLEFSTEPCQPAPLRARFEKGRHVLDHGRRSGAGAVAYPHAIRRPAVKLHHVTNGGGR